ncbi:MAG: hypothetical protein IIA67_01245 [Planctomycetes bacterium]|nr:hypothetical protein [Planctomycetota bacterium]
MSSRNRRIAAVVCIVLLLGVLPAGPCGAQSPSGPSHTHPDAPFSLHKTPSALHNKQQEDRLRLGELLSSQLRPLLAEFKSRIAAGKTNTIVPSHVGKANVMRMRLMRVGEELELMGETAGLDLQARALLAAAELQSVIVALGESPAFSRRLDEATRTLQSRAARHGTLLNEVNEQLRKQVAPKDWVTADKSMQKIMNDLESRSIWLTRDKRIALMDKFYRARRRIDAGLRAAMRRNVARILTEQYHDRAPDFEKYWRTVDEAIQSIEKTGSAILKSDRGVDGPQLLVEIGRLWRLMQVQTVRLRALNWRRLNFGPKGSSEHSTLERDYERFNTRIAASIPRLIAADAARASAAEAPTLYPKYLQALASLTVHVDDDKLLASAMKALDALAAKSPQLVADIRGYRRATDDVLRWRRRVAAARARQHQAKRPSLQANSQTAFLPDEPNGIPGLIAKPGNLPGLRGLSAATMRAISDRMIRQDVHLGPTRGSGAGKSPRHASWLENRIFCELSGSVLVERQVAGLKRDLLAAGSALPLTIDAAIAIARAERGDFVAVGGRVDGVELLSMVDFIANVPTREPYLWSVGRLPRHVDATLSSRPLKAIVVRFSLQPSWVQNEYFFAEIDDATPAK